MVKSGNTPIKQVVKLNTVLNLLILSGIVLQYINQDIMNGLMTRHLQQQLELMLAWLSTNTLSITLLGDKSFGQENITFQKTTLFHNTESSDKASVYGKMKTRQVIKIASDSVKLIKM